MCVPLLNARHFFQMAGGTSTADDCLYYWKGFEEKKPFVLRAEQREKKLEGGTPHIDVRPTLR